MKKVVRLTESDLVRIVKRVISEQSENPFYKALLDFGYQRVSDWASSFWSEDMKSPNGKLYSEIKDSTKHFNYKKVIYFTKGKVKFITDGKLVYFLDGGFPETVNRNFPNPKGPFKVEDIKGYLGIQKM